MTQPPFWQPAQDRNQLWRTLLGLCLIVAVVSVVSAGVVFGAAAVLGLPVWEVAKATGPTTTAAFFLTFIGFHIGLMLTLALLHRRGYTSLFGPSRRLNARHFLLGIAATLAIATALYALYGLEHLVFPIDTVPPLSRNMPLGQWLVWLMPALGLIFSQILAEEALFRGYLLQQLRARFRAPLIWAVLPSAIFGLLHFDSGTYGVINASAYVLNAATLGTIAAFVTVRTGNLAAAAGLHFGNNAMLVAIGLDGGLNGFSLYTIALDQKSGYATYSILTQTAIMVLAFVAWWRWMARHRPIANGAHAA